MIGLPKMQGARRVSSQGVVCRACGEAYSAAHRTVFSGVQDSQRGLNSRHWPIIRRYQVGGFSFGVELLNQLQGAGHKIVEVLTWTDVATLASSVRHTLPPWADIVRVRRLFPELRLFMAPVVDLDGAPRPATAADLQLVAQ